jgi:hypothetical protein
LAGDVVGFGGGEKGDQGGHVFLRHRSLECRVANEPGSGDLIMTLADHPGFMEYEDGSIEILHADWPVYPAGHSSKVVLQSLAMFPQAVHFQQIDDIDRCLLLVATGSGPCLVPQGDLFDEKWFHVAVWRDDLMVLYEQQFVTGVSLVSEYEAATAYYKQHKALLVRTDGGFRKLDLPCPQPGEFEDDRPTVARISPEGIAVTDSGFQANLAAARPLEGLCPEIKERVSAVLAIPLFDTAVREAGVILETRLREIVGSSAFGQDLVREYYKLICSRQRERPSAFFKVLRGELRTLFKFVRNDFAHSLHEISESQCRSLLDRMSQALERINEVEREDAA